MTPEHIYDLAKKHNAFFFHTGEEGIINFKQEDLLDFAKAIQQCGEGEAIDAILLVDMEYEYIPRYDAQLLVATDDCIKKLYLSPQPSVRDALEKALNICEGNTMSWADDDWNNAVKDCANRIKKLISEVE